MLTQKTSTCNNLLTIASWSAVVIAHTFASLSMPLGLSFLFALVYFTSPGDTAKILQLSCSTGLSLPGTSADLHSVEIGGCKDNALYSSVKKI